jgi:hypothetical protein
MRSNSDSMPSAAFAVTDSTNRVIARQAASDTNVSTFHHHLDFSLTSSGPVSAALSTGIWPCCGLPAEFDGCMSTYHIEKVDKMEPEGSPKGKGPRASGKRDGKRKVSEESAEQGPLKRSHLSTSSTSAPRLRETSTTTPNGNPPESLVQGHAELLAQPEMDQLGQGKVMPPDPNGLMPVHQYQMEPHDFEFVDQQDWGLADPQKWVVLDPLDPWFDMPEDNAGNYSNHTLDERELL